MKIYIIQTTFKNEADAKSLQSALLARNLASCMQLYHIKSTYEWEGKICEENEVVLSIKTTKRFAPAVRQIIEDSHPYEIPEILIFKAKPSKKYAKWHRGAVGKGTAKKES